MDTDRDRASLWYGCRGGLVPGEVLECEGGTMVWSKCVASAWNLFGGALPIDLTQGMRLNRAVAKGAAARRADVATDKKS